MTGTAVSQIRSAYISESTAGTIPSTPGFTTLHAPAMVKATPQSIDSASLISGGARLGHGLTGIDVTGTIEDDLVYGVYDDLFATLLQSSWSSDAMDDAKATTTIAIENTMPAGVGGTSTMLRYRGVEATGGTMTLQARSAVRFALDLVGRGSDDATTSAIAGATYTDPTEFDPLSSGADVGSITMAGYTVDCIESMEINFGYERRDLQPKISSDDLCGVTRGDFKPVLTANIYVEANFLAMYNAARDRTNSAFKVTIPIGSVTGEKYTLEFHSCHFGSTEIDTSGTNVMQKVEILPHYNTTEDCVLTITRAVA